MSSWVKCTAENEDRAIYINLDNVVSISRGNRAFTTIMFAADQDANPSAGMLTVQETPEQILRGRV